MNNFATVLNGNLVYSSLKNAFCLIVKIHRTWLCGKRNGFSSTANRIPTHEPLVAPLRCVYVCLELGYAENETGFLHTSHWSLLWGKFMSVQKQAMQRRKQNTKHKPLVASLRWVYFCPELGYAENDTGFFHTTHWWLLWGEFMFVQIPAMQTTRQILKGSG
jgi:hypothetical protein